MALRQQEWSPTRSDGERYPWVAWRPGRAPESPDHRMLITSATPHSRWARVAGRGPRSRAAGDDVQLQALMTVIAGEHVWGRRLASTGPAGRRGPELSRCHLLSMCGQRPPPSPLAGLGRCALRLGMRFGDAARPGLARPGQALALRREGRSVEWKARGMGFALASPGGREGVKVTRDDPGRDGCR